MEPGLSALCAGFERGEWRFEALADHLFEWLPEFALSWEDRTALSASSAMQLVKQAAARIYSTDKYSKRGEFGELILHAVTRQLFSTEPAVSKIFFKDAENDVVKGFDMVHVVPTEDQALELWLGEAKFYENAANAITSVVAELKDHTESDYLRSEFTAILNKVSPDFPHSDALKDLLHRRRSLDEIFEAIRIPVLITYDSTVVAGRSSWDDPYDEEFENETSGIWEAFAENDLPDVHIHLLLVPLKRKKLLTARLHELLKGLNP